MSGILKLKPPTRSKGVPRAARWKSEHAKPPAQTNDEEEPRREFLAYLTLVKEATDGRRATEEDQIRAELLKLDMSERWAAFQKWKGTHTPKFGRCFSCAFGRCDCCDKIQAEFFHPQFASKPIVHKDERSVNICGLYG